MKTCDHCNEKRPNVGPWQDGRQLCGGCKVKITLARPGTLEALAADIGRALGSDRVVLTVGDSTKIVGPRGAA